MMYVIEMFDDQFGFLVYDRKKNIDSAERIADVISSSRKAWMRVVHRGVVIVEYDRRENAENQNK